MKEPVPSALGNVPSITAKFRNLIKNVDYVDFNAMLAAISGKVVTPGLSIAVKSGTTDRQLLLSDSRDKVEIFNFQSWMKAWTLFLGVCVCVLPSPFVREIDQVSVYHGSVFC